MHMSSIFRSSARTSTFPACDLVHHRCPSDAASSLVLVHAHVSSFAAQIQPVEEQGRKNLTTTIDFYPYSLPVGHKSAPYRALDFSGSIDETAHQWVFFGQLRKELMSHQLANLLMDLVGMEPLLIVKKMQCMHVLLRSAEDADTVMKLSGCLLLDYQGAWFADSFDKVQLLSEETALNQVRFLPKAPVTVERCAKPPVIHGAVGQSLRSRSSSLTSSSSASSSLSSQPLPP
jgi:hypothetical protein